MKKTNFNSSWFYTDSNSVQTRFHGGGSPIKKVTLPYDAMILKKRVADGTTTSSGGYFPDGNYVYTKSFFMDTQSLNKHIVIEFGGVYANAMVYINDCFAGKCPHGYSNFFISADPFLKYDAENTIKVVAKSAFDSRWYSGGGIYRDVLLYESNLLYIEPEGIKLRTISIEDDLAVVEALITITNKNINTKKVSVMTKLIDSTGAIAAVDAQPLTSFSQTTDTIRQKLYIHAPHTWSIESPCLYQVVCSLLSDDETIDSDSCQFGLRTISLDPVRGLRINGIPTKLQGGCIHHDNGILGANEYEVSEERRIRILKVCGYNAIRMSHHPASKVLLDVCDRLGMLVMDEAFDMWNCEKTDYDYHLYFHEFYKKDLQRMVSKDYNHPCVILYSIGNEIVEAGDASGTKLGREMADLLRALDETRPILNSVNGIYAARAAMADMAKETGGDINDIMDAIRKKKINLTTDPIIAKCSEESYAAVDVAGYNYLSDRYDMDHQAYPNRLILGSENTAYDLITTWPLVEQNPWLLGNFVWTAWDYIGEAGIGRTDYDTNSVTSNRGVYPWYLAYCGDVDILGIRRPASYFHEILWHKRHTPYIAVQHPRHYKSPSIQTMWTTNDYISSWTYEGYEGKPIYLEVYSRSDEIELILNEKSLGRKKVSSFKAEFDLTYAPGTLKAIAYEQNSISGEETLYSANQTTKISVIPEKEILQSGFNNLCYLNISLTDSNGILKPDCQDYITISVDGPATLLGYGSADPKSEENFFDITRTTFDGRLQAVLRPSNEKGLVTITLTGQKYGTVILTLKVC